MSPVLPAPARPRSCARWFRRCGPKGSRSCSWRQLQQAKSILSSEFPGAMTLQKFQTDLELQRDTNPGTVIVLDEVSMVSVPQLCRLVAFIAERGCRLVLCGDRDQHSSPERGEAIRILQDSHSVRSVQLTETFRPQVPYLKETVLDLKAHRQIGRA